METQFIPEERFEEFKRKKQEAEKISEQISDYPEEREMFIKGFLMGAGFYG